jgi:hypothetical protein
MRLAGTTFWMQGRRAGEVPAVLAGRFGSGRCLNATARTPKKRTFVQKFRPRGKTLALMRQKVVWAFKGAP